MKWIRPTVLKRGENVERKEEKTPVVGARRGERTEMDRVILPIHLGSKDKRECLMRRQHEEKIAP